MELSGYSAIFFKWESYLNSIPKGKNKPVSIYEVYDVDFPEIIELKSLTQKVFEEGFSLYQNKKFCDAKQRFEHCITICPQDNVAKIHLKSCINYLTTKLDSDWDGITCLDIK